MAVASPEALPRKTTPSGIFRVGSDSPNDTELSAVTSSTAAPVAAGTKAVKGTKGAPREPSAPPAKHKRLNNLVGEARIAAAVEQAVAPLRAENRAMRAELAGLQECVRSQHTEQMRVASGIAAMLQRLENRSDPELDMLAA